MEAMSATFTSMAQASATEGQWGGGGGGGGGGVK